MNKPMVSSKERNYGIDLLRIVSMLMVVILHILGQGGVLKAAKTMSAGYEVAWFLEILCYCAVNCYALISGYVGVESRFKYSGIVCIWLQVVFYAVGIAAVAAFILPDVGTAAVVEGLTPVSKNLYWYFTAYFCVFLFIPAFNKMLGVMSNGQLKVLGITIFAVFCIMQIVVKREIFYTNKGYSALWLALLYILGGIMKKTELFSKIRGWVSALLFLAVCFITWIEKFVVDYININGLAEKTAQNRLIQYISPTILLAAVFLVAAFSKMRIGKVTKKLISFFAPLSFGVYLIHVQKHVWIYILKERFTAFAGLSPIMLVLAVLGTAVGIFLLCSMIELARDRLFKLLGIKKSLQKIESKFIGDIWGEKVQKNA
ncbi:MAG: acyltransferase [Acutalibacteraceae bacterium]|nr:acyltransferase [Acutalibacteraceae bacterium]